MSVRGKVVKMVFPMPSGNPLRFFAFREDVEKLFSGEWEFVRIFLDVEMPRPVVPAE